MVVNGVSTRKVSQVVETLCGTSDSKSAVSEVCKDLDAAVTEFRERPLTCRYPFLTVDATYFKVCENHRIISKALMIAFATSDQGHREIVGFGVYVNESKETWRNFQLSLQKRGLAGMIMITSDAHEGVRYVLSEVYPNVPWQRCQFHFSRNIVDKAPKKQQAGIRAELQEMFNCKTISEARRKKDEIIDSYSDVAEAAMTCLDEGFESAMTVMELPTYLRKFYRTSNHIERLNKELKRRSKVIGIFPNEASLLRLMGAVLIERNAVIQNTKAIFGAENCEKLMKSETLNKLVAIAAEQQRLLAA
jgi:putative transposase